MEDESIKRPKHYLINHKGVKGEVRFVIEWAVKLLTGGMAYHHATVLKYMLRAAYKENYWRDLKKAREHLNFLLELENDGKANDKVRTDWVRSEDTRS